MAISIDTHPSEVITNAPEFTVTTTLTEGASYQNVRIRATVYLGLEDAAVAVYEQPKGINDWDFSSLLKGFIGRPTAFLNTLSYYQPLAGGQVVTSWLNLNSNFETFTTSGAELTSVADTNASGGTAYSNDLGTAGQGSIFVVSVLDDWVDSGPNYATLMLVGQPTGGTLHQKQQYAGLNSGVLRANHIYFFMGNHYDTQPVVALQTLAGGNAAFTGTVHAHKISDNRNNPGVFFMVTFTEVYENASDVTTTGDSTDSDTLLYIPLRLRAGETFNDFLSIADVSEGGSYLTRADDGTYPANGIRYKFGIGMEARLMTISTVAYLGIYTMSDAYGAVTASPVKNLGWTMHIISDEVNSSPILATDDVVNLAIYALTWPGLATDYTICSMSITCDQPCRQDAKALSFAGDLGGEETLLFRGLHTYTGRAEKTYYKDVNRVRKVLRAFRYVSLKLRMLFEDEITRTLLHELIYADGAVWMYDPDEAVGYKVVTPVDDEIVIADRNELYEPEITVEYYE